MFFFGITATEAHDDDGLPHTLEHLVFLGSEDFPYKVCLRAVDKSCPIKRHGKKYKYWIGVSLEGEVGEIISLSWLTSPYVLSWRRSQNV